MDLVQFGSSSLYTPTKLCATVQAGTSEKQVVLILTSCVRHNLLLVTLDTLVALSWNYYKD